MILEIYDNKGVQSFGCFSKFKNAKPMLETLRTSGRLAGDSPSVMVSNFRDNVLQGVYRAEYRRGWHLVKEWPACPEKARESAPSEAVTPERPAQALASRKEQPARTGQNARGRTGTCQA